LYVYFHILCIHILYRWTVDSLQKNLLHILLEKDIAYTDSIRNVLLVIYVFCFHRSAMMSVGERSTVSKNDSKLGSLYQSLFIPGKWYPRFVETILLELENDFLEIFYFVYTVGCITSKLFSLLGHCYRRKPKLTKLYLYCQWIALSVLNCFSLYV
jgi:hypothetical protein